MCLAVFVPAMAQSATVMVVLRAKHVASTLYSLTAWCRVLLEQLTGLQLVKKFPAFHGTRRFITALTSVRHLSLSWASQIESITHIPPPADPSEYYPPIYA